MNHVLKGRAREYLFLLVVLSVVSFLHLANLGNRYLWQDEAETALVARTILTHGLPLGHDGKNSFSQDGGAEFGENYLWRRHPWVQYYVVAASFKLLGATTLAARLPFALFGIASIALFHFFAREFAESRTIAALSTILLLLSVPFLLLTRQCRYYSAAIFFTLCGLYAYLMVLRKSRFASVAFVASTFLLFNTNYLYVPALLGATALHALIWHRDRALRVVLLAGIGVLVNLPTLLWFAGMKYYGRTGVETADVRQILLNLWGFGGYIVEYIFAAPLLVVGAVCVVVSLIRRKRVWPTEPVLRGGVWLLFFFIAGTLLVLGLFSPCPYFRYLGSLIPLFCLIGAFVVKCAMRLHVAAGIALLVVLVILSPFAKFLYEITHDYQGPVKGIVTFLNEHASPDDVVAITYGDLPVKFYTDLRVIGALSGDPLSELDHANWVIFRKYRVSEEELRMKEEIARLMNRVGPQGFQVHVLDCPEAIFENSEDPRRHRYRTDWSDDKVVILRRLR